MAKKYTDLELKRMANEALDARAANDPRWEQLLTFFCAFSGTTEEEAIGLIEGWANG